MDIVQVQENAVGRGVEDLAHHLLERNRVGGGQGPGRLYHRDRGALISVVGYFLIDIGRPRWIPDPV